MTSYANTSAHRSLRNQPSINASPETDKDGAVFVLDCNGRIQSWSDHAEVLHGYSPSEIVGQPFELCFAPEARAEGLPSLLLKQSASRGHARGEVWQLRKDGAQFWASVTMTGLADVQGALLGHAVVTRALLSRRPSGRRVKHGDELLHGEERFRLLVDSVHDYAIFMLDAGGIVSTWNSGAQRIYGYKAEQIIGQHFSLFHTADDIEAGGCERELAIAAAGGGKMEEEGWRIRKDGSRFWANVALTPIVGRSGQLIGFAKVTRDLTQRQLLDEERLQRARAEEAVRLRDDFLLVASHELRTPLTSLRLDLYGMQQDLLRDPAKLGKKLERAARNADRLAALVESLLSASRLVHGKLVLHPVPVELVQLVSRSADDIRSQAVRAGCEIELVLGPPVLGVWDGLRLEQVFMNLLSNAVKHGPGAPVEVRVFADTVSATVEISDRGPGIPESDLDRIFRRFEPSSTPGGSRGLGLGLYLSRELVHAHAGSIQASNRPGGGATFTVRLPVRPGGPHATPAEGS
jgi:PAS domain S-box-containing protein